MLIVWVLDVRYLWIAVDKHLEVNWQFQARQGGIERRSLEEEGRRTLGCKGDGCPLWRTLDCSNMLFTIV